VPYLVIDIESRVPVYMQIMDKIREGIGAGALPPGSPLPSVRQLASDLGVNPNTVARAYNLLEREGTLRTAGRKGTFVAETGPESVRRARETDLERAVDEIIERTADLGIEQSRLLEALRSRLQDPEGEPHGRKRHPKPGNPKRSTS
jgi:GntR family transcriptional regulator